MKTSTLAKPAGPFAPTRSRSLFLFSGAGAFLGTALICFRCAGAAQPSAWPQAYTVQREDGAGTLTLSTPYYTIQHNLKQGGALASLRLTHGKAANLLLQPLKTSVQNDSGDTYSDVHDSAPRITQERNGLLEIVRVSTLLKDKQGNSSGLQVQTTYEYHWGFIKIHKQIRPPVQPFLARDLCLVNATFSPSLSDYGYREGLTEQEGAPPFSFGSCRWGTLSTSAGSALRTKFLPRYVMLADPGTEGLEWFVGSDLSEWDLQATGQRGQGMCVLESGGSPAGVRFSVSPFQAATNGPISLTNTLVFDYYLGFPILEGHARKPWFHTSFNRNRGEWVSAEQVRRWADSGIQTVHCHNDGDYYDDGLFWRDGAYPPYPDMDKYDQVLENCRRAGIRSATYFSNKELHPSTQAFQEHGAEWARKDLSGKIQTNIFKGQSAFGAQMCLRSGWLAGLEANIGRVLGNHPLDGVYYDWNVALFCRNALHEGKSAGQQGNGHWDIDELLMLMEWTRQRVGPNGLVIVHNTTTPMFATENFADDVVANEWGYGKWSGDGPELSQLPLEWSLVGARSRGVISYGQLDASSSRRLHRLFALEALVSGVTPWPASPETFELYPVLKPIAPIETFRFADWRNDAVTLQGTRCASAVYSRPGEAFVLVGNLSASDQEVRCTVKPEKLPYPLAAPCSAILVPLPKPAEAGSNTDKPLDGQKLVSEGVSLSVPGTSTALLHLESANRVR